MHEYDLAVVGAGSAGFSAAITAGKDRALLVDGVPLPAARTIIATGAAPAVPDIPGISGVPFLSSTSALELP